MHFVSSIFNFSLGDNPKFPFTSYVKTLSSVHKRKEMREWQCSRPYRQDSMSCYSAKQHIVTSFLCDGHSVLMIWRSKKVYSNNLCLCLYAVILRVPIAKRAWTPSLPIASSHIPLAVQIYLDLWKYKIVTSIFFKMLTA